jgi:hypothetical protein
MLPCSVVVSAVLCLLKLSTDFLLPSQLPIISVADLRKVEKFAITEMEVERLLRTMRSTAPSYDSIPSWV